MRSRPIGENRGTWLAGPLPSVALATLGFASCHPVELLVLSNESQAPINVTASHPISTSAGRQVPCDLARTWSDPRAHRSPEAGDLIDVARDLDWAPIAGLVRDNEQCAHRFALDPGFAAVIDIGRACGEETDIAGVTIESGDTRLAWFGSDVKKAFEEHRHVCLYRYRQP